MVITMTIEEKLNKISDKQIIKRDNLYDMIKKFHPDYKDSSIRWVIHRLVTKGIISKINHKQFIKGVKKLYQQKFNSQDTNKIIDLINKDYPNIKIVVYESTLLNEWVNQQISRKTIFVEVEKYYMADVFRSIYDNVSNRVLLNPKTEDFYLYTNDLIVVNALVTQAPINSEKRTIKIEKLIVDLFTKDLITEFVNEDEKEEVVQSIIKSYIVNEKTLYAYAKRRSNLEKVKKTIDYIKSMGERNDF